MKKTSATWGILAAFFTPFVPMLNLYVSNYRQIYLAHMLVVALALGLISVFLFVLVRWITKSVVCGMACAVLAWVLFFSRSLQKALEMMPWLYMSLGIGLILLLTAGIWFLTRRRDVSALPVLSFLFVLTLLAQNVISVVGIQRQNQVDETIRTRDDFSIDMSLPSPNIYWIHTDGMLGFDAMEYFFGDSQTEYVSQLQDRGFVINKSAQFEALHLTKLSVVQLFSPQYYDNSIAPLLAETAELRKQTITREPSASVFNWSEITIARKQNELMRALKEKGYCTATIASGDGCFPITSDFYYNSSAKSIQNPIVKARGKLEDILTQATMEEEESLYELADLLYMATLLPNTVSKKAKEAVDQYYRTERWETAPSSLELQPSWHEPLHVSDDNLSATRGLLETFTLTQPRFVIFTTTLAHFPFLYDEDGNEYADDDTYEKNSLYNYPGQHKYTAKYLIDIIDFIVEEDPLAVIVLQADHGPHNSPYVVDFVCEKLGESEDMLSYMWNSTISAVRIPEVYGTLEEPLHPLNISRYLVNRFVGEGNYEYLDPEKIIVK